MKIPTWEVGRQFPHSFRSCLALGRFYVEHNICVLHIHVKKEKNSNFVPPFAMLIADGSETGGKVVG
jgi:hypothetical protein